MCREYPNQREVCTDLFIEVVDMDHTRHLSRHPQPCYSEGAAGGGYAGQGHPSEGGHAWVGRGGWVKEVSGWGTKDNVRLSLSGQWVGLGCVRGGSGGITI